MTKQIFLKGHCHSKVRDPEESAAKGLPIAQNQDFVFPSARNKKSVSIFKQTNKKVSLRY